MIEKSDLATAVEQAADGIVITDTEGRIRYVNPAFTAMTGYTREEVQDQSTRILKSGRETNAFYKGLWTTIQSGKVWNGEITNRRKGGSLYREEMRISPVFSSTGVIESYIGIKHDVTEQRAAQKALRESEERFRTMADCSPSMMWVTDAAGEIQFINRTYREFGGIAVEDLQGGKWQVPIHPDDLPEYSAAFQHAIEDRALFTAEVRTRRSDGEWRIVGANAQPRLSADGEYLGHVGVSADITDRKQAEQTRQRSEIVLRQTADRLMLATRAGGVGVWSNYLEHDMLAWDEQMFRLYGIAKNQFGGTCETWLALLHPEDRQRMSEENEAATRGEKEFDTEFRVVWPDGSVHHIRALALVKRDASGKAIHIVGTNWDITAQKQTSEELLASNHRLEEETSRANQLAIEAEQASAAKSKFLANMSHEIRTPMNGVLGMVQVLLETGLTPEQRRYLEVAQASGRTLLSLIDNILNLSKMEAGKVVLESVDFDIRRTVADIMELSRVQASAKNLEFSSQISPDLPKHLRGDPTRLSQVLNNLLVNAVKFTECGGVALNVDLVCSDIDKVTVRFSVTDSGIGIELDQAAALFSPFVQADVSTTRKYGGTGLGLAICKQLVELMGGAIEVESQIGKGSVFSFTVAFAAPSEAATATLPAPSPSLLTQNLANHETEISSARQGEGSLAAHPVRILVAEDNATNRAVAMAQLGQLGYAADAVADGAEAVEALQHGAYGLVLMDCEMPVMDGYEATRRIRQSSHSQIPIVAVTAHAMSTDRDRCILEGMNDFVSKPVDLARLAEVLTKFVGPTVRDVPRIIRDSHGRPAIETFDAEGLLKRLMGDRELATIILKGFLEDVPSQLENLHKKFAEADGPGARRQAHSLKGAAATVSAEGLRFIASEMECAASVGDLDRLGELLPQTIEELKQFKMILEHAGWIDR